MVKQRKPHASTVQNALKGCTAKPPITVEQFYALYERVITVTNPQKNKELRPKR